ncbi:MAG TPA: hypothetical protein VKZ86_12400 [Cyclobacteriaceae bacterium]|nr:hypothetical protein [Cyclobacteriaceae bacterium]
MSYKPDEGALIAYLYGELDGAAREKVERYLAGSEDARRELEALKAVRDVMGLVRDKEVIAPPLVIDNRTRFLNFSSPVLRTALAIAASLVLLMVVGKLTGVQVTASGNELKLTFGTPRPAQETPSLDVMDVQSIVDARLASNNAALQEEWKKSQEAFNANVRESLEKNSSQIDRLVTKAAAASEEQISAYVSTLQAENLRMIKDYYKMTSEDQKEQLEQLLVDFAKYLQQQREDDLLILQARLNDLQQNTDMYRQETEQILASIISNASVPVIRN